MWKALHEKSLAERGKCCKGGKNATQRITAAFFVNAAGGKEIPTLIDSSKEPLCFTNLPDISTYYFSNDKAWMKSDIMINVLTKLNNKLKHTDRQILLFLDIVPYHPSSIKGIFLNIKLEFLPKNTTLCT